MVSNVERKGEIGIDKVMGLLNKRQGEGESWGHTNKKKGLRERKR
jgi:hypothetical protein